MTLSTESDAGVELGVHLGDVHSITTGRKPDGGYTGSSKGSGGKQGLHSPKAEALEVNEGATSIEAEEGLPLYDGMLSEPAPHHIIWSVTSHGYVS